MDQNVILDIGVGLFDKKRLENWGVGFGIIYGQNESTYHNV